MREETEEGRGREREIYDLPCLALPCLTLPCLALPCLAMPCLALPSNQEVSLVASQVDV